jgi:heterodisulfide reductase subunit C/nitrate reductase gamma subunit
MQPFILATIALGICLAGTLWRIGRWFWSDIGPESLSLPTKRRMRAARQTLWRVFSGRRLFKVVGAFQWEVLLLGHLLRRHPLRWAAHMLIGYGLLTLILFHALDDWITPLVFSDYEPTLNPFRWLRNLLGALVLMGVLATVVRHFRQAGEAFRTPGDRLLLVLIVVVVLSGVLLESARILSPAVFDAMVEDYMGDDDPEEVAALQAYWAAEFGAWRARSGTGFSGEQIKTGASIHETFCAACHDRPQSAFLSYPLSRLMKPLMAVAGDHRLNQWLWNVHFWATCLALACLPFSKLFHFIATPISIMVRAAGPAAAHPALQPVRRALALDACTHCGMCSQHCSVAPIYKVLGNPNILPAEKLKGIKRFQTHRKQSLPKATLVEGSFICTLCGRCTQWCPSGIDLQDLWQASRKDMIQSGAAPLRRRSAPPLQTALVPPAPASLGLSDRPETFWACVQCTTCTSVCPVVAVSEDPQRDLGLTPQQIMNLMRLQLKEQAMDSRMLWDCVTCYKCQEHCPQDVKVADVLYELRNEAWHRGARSDQRAANQPPHGSNF